MAPRFRTGIDQVTGQPLSGWPHCAQSIGVILTTNLRERVMRLDFGSVLISHLGRNIVPPVVLAIYADATSAVHTHEPEFRIERLQLVSVTRTGGLGLLFWGTYFPEGRFGNYSMSQAADGRVLFVTGEAGGRGGGGLVA